jgi:hypothetical protein
MARGPYQGTFQPNARPTVVTAPDAIVHINGQTEISGCPQCSRSFDLNKFITSIQTDLGIDSVPGSASISLAIPRHAIDDFYFDGVPVITTMMEVEIYAKGHFLVEGMPQYYPIFWGMITEVQDNYSSGEHTVSLHCADILKWWEISKINTNPAVAAAAGDQGRSLVGNVFAEKNAYDIIYTLASQSIGGDVLIAQGSMQNFIRDEPERVNAAMADMMAYWKQRFTKMRSNLVLYGIGGAAVSGETLFQKFSKRPTASANGHMVANVIRDANGDAEGMQMFYDPASAKNVAMKSNMQNAGPGDLMQSEYQTKLELANAAKEAAGFEFFMDVNGDIVFKPPFYNLDVLGNKPLSWIQDIDIMDWDFSESESEVVTQIVMQGDFNSTMQSGTDPITHPLTTVTDYHLLRKYGWRSQSYNAEFVTDPVQLYYHGLDVLDRLNAKRFRGNVTIPIRPELRLGFPIYIAPKDQIWYVSGISHSIAFGGRASTTLQLTARRTKFVAPRGIGDLKLTSFANKPVSENKDGSPATFRYSSRELQKNGVFTLKRNDAAEIPAPRPSELSEPLILRHPRTGRIVGYPNMTMVFSRPFTKGDVKQGASKASNSRVAKSQKEAAAKNREANLEVEADKFSASRDSELQAKYLHNTFQYGLNAAGVFIYAHDSSPGGGVIREALTLPTKNLIRIPKQAGDNHGSAPMALIRPVSDERGFEVIGHYQYGRRVSLRDGRLIVNGPGEAAKIDLQLALSGDLSSMLTAQSQGLTTVVTGYSDPAAELAVLTPDDAQTAAAYPAAADGSPTRNAPVFTDVGDSFVDTATLGSQEQRGVSQSVEATQLSRALTLAEMSIREVSTANEGDCVCLTGRADLAFMSSHYQVDVLSGFSAPDYTDLEPPQPAAYVSTETQAYLHSQANSLKAKLDALQKRIDKAKTNEELDVLLEEDKSLAEQYTQALGNLSQANVGRLIQDRYEPKPIHVTAVASSERKAAIVDTTIASVSERLGGLEAEKLSLDATPGGSQAIELASTIERGEAERTVLEARIAQEQDPVVKNQLQKTLVAHNKAIFDLGTQLRALQLAGPRQTAAVQSMINDASAYLEILEHKRESATQEVEKATSQYGNSIYGQKNSKVMSRVEAFLFKLYSTLDKAHEQYEKAVRGDLTVQTNVTAQQLHKPGVTVPTAKLPDPNAPDIGQPSEFAPPFSAPNRYQLGDPRAAIGAAQSNVEGMSHAWSDFGRKLKSEAESKQRSTQIGQDKASIARLTASRDQLIKQRDSGATIVIGTDLQKQIDSFSTQIGDLEKRIAENQMKMSEAR